MTGPAAGRAMPGRERPWLTFALLGANGLAFVACAVLAGQVLVLTVPVSVLLLLGANVAPFTQFAGAWENLLTSTFLHGGLAHLLFNLVALWQVGPFVERTVGRARYATIYGVSALAASATSMLAANYGYLAVGLAVGASGAICGLIGGAAVLGFRIEGKKSPLAFAMLRWLGIIVVLGYAISASGKVQVDNFAHLGGAASGALCALLFRRSVQYTGIGRTLRIALLLAASAAAFAVQLGRGETMAAAKVRYLLGACDETKLLLRELRVGPRNEQEILRRCEQRQ